MQESHLVYLLIPDQPDLILSLHQLFLLVVAAVLEVLLVVLVELVDQALALAAVVDLLVGLAILLIVLHRKEIAVGNLRQAHLLMAVGAVEVLEDLALVGLVLLVEQAAQEHLILSPVLL